MNVYQCCYLGLKGYCCRRHNSKWMFVPELGQTNSIIQKYISLNDLAFNNSFAKEYELKIENNMEKIKTRPLYFIRALLFPAKKTSTVGGMLFAPI